MRVMGIDPGLGTSGWAIVDGEGEARSLLASGAIRTKPTTDMAERLLTICNAVRDLVAIHHPEEFAIEDIFLAKDARAAFALGQARGAAMVGAALQGLPVYSYTALQVKKAVTGNGHASKDQVGYMVIRLLDLKEALHPADSADAAAIALCHLSRCNSPVALMGEQA